MVYDLWSGRSAGSALFLFLRTRLALSASDEPLEALADAGLIEADLLGFPSGPRENPWGVTDSWKDGYVFRTNRNARPSEVAEELKDALALFDAWAIHDGDALYAEGPLPALVTDYYARHRGGSVMVGVQIAEGAHRPDEIYDRVRAALPPLCRPVFHFRNGRIFMFPAGAPANRFWERVQKSRRDIEHLVAWDRFGTGYYKQDEVGEELWERVATDEITFGHVADGS